ncbi:MAG TPA: translation initiation factor IF-2, partial [Planctomycetota bacterium]|nr:translation initiation factor IF-2 [Planctomycetota bacterium]
PTRRRGARILGRIELKPKDLPARHRPPTPGGAKPTEFDPLDPTRPANPRRGIPLGPTPRKTAAEVETAKPGKAVKTKPGGFEWVFDPEDNSALAAIRIGHFAGQRRPTTRRPPVRRSSMGGSRKRRGPVDRPSHGIEVRPPIGVRELSEELGVKTREILMHFPGTFDPRDKNAIINEEQLLELAVKMNREITVLPPETEEDRLLAYEDARALELATESRPRPPVVAVMGHVDHGKTSLLDALRKTQVAAGEAGGITQRSSAYLVRTPSGAAVTFLDTPGHKAFTEMRARGAELTDVAVLVVAADDGVMEQTQEAIDHAKAASAPMVVAINKMDKPGADPRMVRQQLATAGVMVEDWGGEIGVVEVSAVTGKGLNELVERLALETEILELRADPGIPARGVIVDSRKDNKLGIVVTAVVMNGTLRAKDAVLAGTAVGRVRYMLDDRGARIEEAGPSVPVQILGFEDVPESGSDLLVVEDINAARGVAKMRQQDARQEALVPAAVDTVTLENLFSTIEARKVTELNVMIKADGQGTLDVLKRTIEELKHPEVRFKVIRGAVGGITEDDVLLASASKSLIIGFAVTADVNARAALARTGVEVKYYDVIYEMVDDLEKALEGQLSPERREQITGHVTIREVFKISRYGSIAGCYVTDGIITRDSRIRLTRDSKVIWTGKLDSLKRFKDDVKEVRENYECGLHLAGYDDIRQGDVLETFEVTEVRRTLSSPTTKA